MGLYIVQITRVHFPVSYDGRERKIAYVEFTDEDAMNAGLEKRAEVFLSHFFLVEIL